LQRRIVHPAATSAPEAWHCIGYNISATGIGITLMVRLDPGSFLTIQAWGLAGACRLQARIVQSKRVEFLWFTGCELLKPLTDDELQIWRSGPRDWLDAYKEQ